jgi:hypothetical protein
MQLGQRHVQVIGLGMCVIAFIVAAVVSWRDSPTPMRALKGTSAVVDLGTENGGSIAATVSWPAGAAARADICVVVFDENGSVADERVGRLEPIPGEDVAGRWKVEGLAAGRYTVYVAECVTPTAEPRAWIEPQFLGGADDAEAATWVDVVDGDRVDVGTIALRSTRDG